MPPPSKLEIQQRLQRLLRDKDQQGEIDALVWVLTGEDVSKVGEFSSIGKRLGWQIEVDKHGQVTSITPDLLAKEPR
jgi:hypothetical protein